MSLSVALSFGITLLIFSYLLADNFLYRLGVAVLVGLAAAFTSIVTFESVLLPLILRVADTSASFETRFAFALLLGVAGVFTLLLLFKPFPALKSVTGVVMAYLVAVGTASAVVGTITGTLIPLVERSATFGEGWLGIVNTLVGVLGIVTSLLYFQSMAQRNADGIAQRPTALKGIATVGQAFIVITLGVMYGAAILTSLTILTGHLYTLLGG